MISTVCTILGVITSIVSIIFLVIGLKENDFSFLGMTLFTTVMVIVLFCLSWSNKEREGKVLQILVTQDSCVQSLNEEGELVFVPTYSYLIIFEADDGEYRIFTTTNVNYGILKEGDSITYTLSNTEEIKKEE
jgi:hypothetical protein